MKIFDKKNECCGCMACVDSCPRNAIRVKYDYKGFLYPVINQKLCVGCGKCKTICAFGNETVNNMNYEKEVYACKHKNEEDRKSSSSGGAYTAISDYILNNGGVVYGAAYDGNDSVVHIRCTTPEQRNLTRGSKYVQGDMRGVYKNIKADLECGKKVLFAGVPCQCAEVKKLFSDFENLYLVDIICHGVPSPGIFKEHINYIEKVTRKSVKEYLFRHKIEGLKGRNKRSCVIFNDGTLDYESPFIQVYCNLFDESKILRPSCFSCKYTNKNRMGDVTIGDFWGVEKALPEFEDKKGVSAIIVNTQKGKELFEAISDDIESIQSDYDTVSNHNPNLLRPSKEPKKSKIFWGIYLMGRYQSLIGHYTKTSALGRLRKFVKRTLKF